MNSIRVTEEQVKQLLPVSECIEVLRDAFSREFVNIPRYRLKSKNTLLHVMSASIPDLGIMGLKSYGTSKESAGDFVVLLFNEQNGKLMGTFEADALGQIRTGAASGLATSYLSRKDATIAAVIGTGFQAETQLVAIQNVRKLNEIRIYSRSKENRTNFVQKMQPLVKARLIPSDTAEDAVRNADIICTITSSKTPVVFGDWLKPGVHINAAGSNWVSKREIDEAGVRRSDLIVVDHREQSKIEAGDLIGVVEDWNNVYELADVVQGKVARTSTEQITLYKSNGIAVEDIASALHIYKKIVQQ
ncbi:MAG TPA: ornithine cyclodeaminase family protein [Acidobacteriota bacterium]|nr:ornithine cyclodeaminase family protein [Acidobacteriota bacterium]